MTRLNEAKPFIVAEVGSNWQSLDHCLLSISAAKQAGADAVKFQAFNATALYGFLATSDDPKNCYPGSYWNLDLDWLPALKAHADAVGIEFMCTAFSPELVAAVDPFVGVHKIASSDATWPQLLSAVARCAKPVLLSTGAKNEAEIEYALRLLPTLTPVILLYCVASYPSRMVNLVEMTALAQRFRRRVGFSDHTTDIVGAPYQATLAGACVIEKHFTAFPELSTPDRPHSLGPNEFKMMVEYLRGQRRPCIGPKPEERDMVMRHSRRLIATRDLFEGEKLHYGVNYGAFRALEEDARGLSPFAWEQVEGRVTTRRVARGTGIGTEDFK